VTDDIVLFGATGFTGRLTAEYLARHAPSGCRWSLAGRNRRVLADVRDRLAEIDPDCGDLALLHADVTDLRSVRAVAERARVVITTVGPYLRHGGPLVAACADAGTDYVDLTGEPEFIDRTYLRHHARAVETGARIVHACGFDSVPHDLGARYTVRQLPEGVPLQVSGRVRAGGGAFSGGTFHSAITQFSRVRQLRDAARQRRQVEPPPVGRRARAVTGGLHREDGRWLVPLPTVDPQVVARSAAADQRYGPDFTYRHYAEVRHLPVAVGGMLAVGGLVLAAQLPPLRSALLRTVKVGGGPSPERRAQSWFRVRFLGEGGGHRVVTEVAGGDPGYDGTAAMIAEAALCLAFDDNPPTAGQVTTATAMGDALTRRLGSTTMTFRVLRG
jgi:saccharopine dehydrogenase (NAD+, L-glutamate forming)